MRFRTVALAAAAGAAIAYLLDPMSGSARRRRLRERIRSMPIGRRRRLSSVAPMPDNLVPTSTPDRPAASAPASAPVMPAPAIPAPPTAAVPEPALAPGIPETPAAVADDEGGPDDATIAKEVRAKLESRTDLETDRLVIDVVRGVAYLRGDVKDPQTFDEIVDVTGSVHGVRRVQSLLHLPESDPAVKPAPAPLDEIGRG